MICLTCNYYTRTGGTTVAPRCNWRASPSELADWRARMPSPTYSRALILSTPVDVVACSQFVGVAP